MPADAAIAPPATAPAQRAAQPAAKAELADPTFAILLTLAGDQDASPPQAAPATGPAKSTRAEKADTSAGAAGEAPVSDDEKKAKADPKKAKAAAGADVPLPPPGTVLPPPGTAPAPLPAAALPPVDQGAAAPAAPNTAEGPPASPGLHLGHAAKLAMATPEAGAADPGDANDDAALAPETDSGPAPPIPARIPRPAPGAVVSALAHALAPARNEARPASAEPDDGSVPTPEPKPAVGRPASAGPPSSIPAQPSAAQAAASRSPAPQAPQPGVAALGESPAAAGPSAPTPSAPTPSAAAATVASLEPGAAPPDLGPPAGGPASPSARSAAAKTTSGRVASADRGSASPGNSADAPHAEAPGLARAAVATGQRDLAQASPAADDGLAAGDTPLPGEDLAGAPDSGTATGLPPPPQGAAAAAAPQGAGVATAGTASQLAAQMVRRIDGRSSRFDVQLDPAGLGQVRVSVEIDARGRLSASLAFERPESAAALREHAQVLKAALERAGFDLSNGGLSFDAADDRGSHSGGAQENARQDTNGAPFGRSGRAFAAAAETASQTDLAARARAAPAVLGLDIRI